MDDRQPRRPGDRPAVLGRLSGAVPRGQGKYPLGLSADSLDEATLRQWISRLENVVRWQPTHLLAHLRLAETHQRLFERLQLDGGEPRCPCSTSPTRRRRPSARACSSRARRWPPGFRRPSGPTGSTWNNALDHARTAVTLCPLGRASLPRPWPSCRSSAATTARMHRACIEQALCVRPLDGAVLFAVSQDAVLAGDRPAGWNTQSAPFAPAVRSGSRCFANYVASTPAEGLPALADSIVRDFQPDWETLRSLYALCAARCPPEALAPLARDVAERAGTEAADGGPRRSSRIMARSRTLHTQLGDRAKATECAQRLASATRATTTSTIVSGCASQPRTVRRGRAAACGGACNGRRATRLSRTGCAKPLRDDSTR